MNLGLPQLFEKLEEVCESSRLVDNVAKSQSGNLKTMIKMIKTESNDKNSHVILIYYKKFLNE